MEKRLSVGVDLGATKISAALVAADGQIQHTLQVPTLPARGAGEIMADIARMVDELAQKADGDLAGVGIGSPGVVDPEHGFVRSAFNLGWEEVGLVEGVQSRLRKDLPISIDQDVNALALGEYYFGAAQDCKDFVVMTIGSGLGGAAFANGLLIHGAAGNAMEIGHYSLDPEGPLCVCGMHGCAETVVSGPGLVRVVRQMLAVDTYATRLDPGSDLIPPDIVAAASRGDELAQAALWKVGRTLGVVMAACCAVLNPARMIVGGSLGLAAFDPLLTAARTELERRIVPASNEKLGIFPSRLHSSAVGAACLVWYTQHV